MHQSRQAIFACSSTALRLECCCSLSRISLIFFGLQYAHTCISFKVECSAFWTTRGEKKTALVECCCFVVFCLCCHRLWLEEEKKPFWSQTFFVFVVVVLFVAILLSFNFRTCVRVCVCVFRSFYFDSVHAFSCCTGFWRLLCVFCCSFILFLSLFLSVILILLCHTFLQEYSQFIRLGCSFVLSLFFCVATLVVDLTHG